MRYIEKLGVFGNIKKLFSESTKTNNTVSLNKAETDNALLELQADTVEAVMDEYYAVIGEEPKESEAENV